MLFRNLFIKYYAAAGEGGGEGGGNGGGNEPEITPELQAIIDARVNDSVTGLQNKNNELLGKLKKATETLKPSTESTPILFVPSCSVFPTMKRQS